MFGPAQDIEQGQWMLATRLVHAAVNAKPPELENVFLSNAEDAMPLIYIKDMARAIAMLHTAEKLQHSVYNVGSETAVPNLELVDTIKRVAPKFEAELPPGHSPFLLPVMETRRLREDTGFYPKFDTYTAIQDYVEWLKAGNPK